MTALESDKRSSRRIFSEADQCKQPSRYYSSAAMGRPEDLPTTRAKNLPRPSAANLLPCAAASWAHPRDLNCWAHRTHTEECPSWRRAAINPRGDHSSLAVATTRGAKCQSRLVIYKQDNLKLAKALVLKPVQCANRGQQLPGGNLCFSIANPAPDSTGNSCRGPDARVGRTNHPSEVTTASGVRVNYALCPGCGLQTKYAPLRHAV